MPIYLSFEMPSLKFGGMKFLPSDMSAFLLATLLVAVNELRRSARAKGTSFYKYGMYFRNVGVLYHHLYLPKITKYCCFVPHRCIQNMSQCLPYVACTYILALLKRKI